MPETTAPVTSANERDRGKAEGETVLMVKTSRAPANPASPELKEKAKTFWRPV